MRAATDISRAILAFLLAAGLSACGGGGASSALPASSIPQSIAVQRVAAQSASIRSAIPNTTYKVVYNFLDMSVSDGDDPLTSVTNVGGTLYGTTLRGGAHAAGTAFSLATTGLEVVMHSFAGTGGAQPYAALTRVGGDLYGTTTSGGSGTGCVLSNSKGCGTVFTLGKAAP